MTSKLRKKKLRENVNKYLRTATTTRSSKRIQREEEETIIRDETSGRVEKLLGDIKGRICR